MQPCIHVLQFGSLPSHLESPIAPKGSRNGSDVLPTEPLEMLWVHNLHPDSVFRAQISLIHFKLFHLSPWNTDPFGFHQGFCFRWDSKNFTGLPVSNPQLWYVHRQATCDTLRTLNGLNMLLFQVSSYLWCMWCTWEWLDQCSPHSSVAEFKRISGPSGNRQKVPEICSIISATTTFRSLEKKKILDRNPLGLTSLTINVWSFLQIVLSQFLFLRSL